MESTMSEKYHPIVDNYLLSIPATPYEIWRNSLQILYDTMKGAVSEPLGIRGYWFDMHEDLSEDRDSRFAMSDAEVILGVRKIAYASFFPEFLKHHEKFFASAWSLSPESKISLEERSSLAREIVENHKLLIDKTRKAREGVRERDLDAVLSTIPDEFGSRAHIASRLKMYAGELECFSYPRCSAGCGGPTKDYSAALGDFYLFQEATEVAIKERDTLIFVPADDLFYEETYPVSSSYQSCLRFCREVYESIDLVNARVRKMMRILDRNQ